MVVMFDEKLQYCRIWKSDDDSIETNQRPSNHQEYLMLWLLVDVLQYIAPTIQLSAAKIQCSEITLV
jgi:hypothetical protein